MQSALKVLAFLGSTVFSSAVADDDLVVKLSDGSQVRGHYGQTGVREWDGIPYATPPVGELRWEAPLKAASWGGVREPYGAPGCIQNCNLPYGTCGEFGYSEDCLYLTVWAPEKQSEDPAGYPVHFFIHGGAFTQGLGDCAGYNGTQWAENGVVSVIINYRLGAMGYMASESMTGNYGVMDQILALQWTQDNVQYFGGNPQKVTMAGQSAGAESVATILTAPSAKSLFQGAIIQSNPLALPAHSRASAGKNAKDVFEYLNCDRDDVACMKTKSPEEVLTAQKAAPQLDLHNLFINFQTFSPMVDGDLIPDQPLFLMQRGAFPPVPILAGNVAEEGWLFVYELFPEVVSKIEYDGLLRVLFGKDVFKEVQTMYPFDMINGAAETDGRNALSRLGTDLLMYCSLRNATRSWQTAQGATAKPVYHYEHRQIIAEDIWEPSNPYCVDHDCHGSDLPFIFNAWGDNKDHVYEITSSEKLLSQDMGHAWSNFVATGNPNLGLEVPPSGFPLYEGQSDELAVLQEPGFGVVSHYKTEYCALWDRIGYYW